MPGRDGTGPKGYGIQTERGLGGCLGANTIPYGACMGLGWRRGAGGGRGFGRRFAAGQASPKTEKELLMEQKRLLEQRLEAVSRSLESL